MEPDAVQDLESVQTDVLVSVEESLKVKKSVLDLQEKEDDTAENASEKCSMRTTTFSCTFPKIRGIPLWHLEQHKVASHLF